MPDFLSIQVTGLDTVVKALNTAPKRLSDGLDKVLESAARDVELRAKQKVTKGIGGLANSIGVKSEYLQKEITANAFYASPVEFGTGKYAAQYVSTLPEDWQTYARQFKGQKGGGTWQEFLIQMQGWVRRKGLAGTYSAKTQRRKGNKANREAEDKALAYIIARSIIINGVRPHPFLYPAFNEVRPKLIADIDNLISTFAL